MSKLECRYFSYFSSFKGYEGFQASLTTTLKLGFENQKASNWKGLLLYVPRRVHCNIMGQWSEPPWGTIEAWKSPPRCIALSKMRNDPALKLYSEIPFIYWSNYRFHLKPECPLAGCSVCNLWSQYCPLLILIYRHFFPPVPWWCWNHYHQSREEIVYWNWELGGYPEEPVFDLNAAENKHWRDDHEYFFL